MILNILYDIIMIMMCIKTFKIKDVKIMKKTVLVTGASRGIGKACALKFAQNGYHVFINCRSSVNALEVVKTEIESNGGTCTIVTGNVGNPDDVRDIFKTIKEVSEGIDVLINNAGISYIGLLTDMTDSDWDNIISTNLSSVFYCSRAALPYMVSKKSGKIVNISSMWGTCGASCEVAYSASKSGMNGFTRALSKELAPSNIQVNSIACGVIDTEMNACFSDEEREDLMYDIPAGRFADPFEVADLAYTLSTGHEYMTGQVIGLDGGYV